MLPRLGSLLGWVSTVSSGRHSVPVAEALGYTKTLSWVNLDPPLIETFAVISRDPTNLSPATRR